MKDFKDRLIIILEHSKNTALRIENKLRDYNMKVRTVSKGVDGLQMVHHLSPDVVIIDAILHDINGIEVLKYLKNDPVLNCIPVIAYSTITDNINEIYFSDADVFLKKDSDFLENVVQNTLGFLEKNNKIQIKKNDVSEEEILYSIDQIYREMQLCNEYIKKLLEYSPSLDDPESILKNFLSFLMENFDIYSVYFIFRIGSEINIYKQKIPALPREIDLQLGKKMKRVFMNYNHIDPRSKNKITEIELPPGSLDNIPPGTVKSLVYSFKLNESTGGIGIFHSLSERKKLENLRFTAACIKKLAESLIIHRENQAMARQLNTLFTNFLPGKVIADLLKKQNDENLMIGEKRNIAVIFSHIKNFGFIEKENSAEDVVAFLNKHFTALSGCIKKYGGEINKFIGDAVFAMFGAPESFEDNSKRASLAAREMLASLENLPVEKINFPDSGYKIGIGIHVGKAIIGNIGSSDNFDYTAIGDTINLAARLESLCKYYHTGILVSENVKNECRQYNAPVEFREIDTVMVKGKNTATTIFSIENTGRFPPGFIKTYCKGLKMFKLGNWNLAENYFTKCSKSLPGDRISEIYLERCKKFIKTPPERWDGAIVLDFK